MKIRLLTTLFSQSLASLKDTQKIASILAPLCQAADTLCLHGEMGTGKTAFARLLIQSLLNHPEEVVQSPTFPIMLTYEGPAFDIIHADLWRLNTGDTQALGIEEYFTTHLLIIEWPDRLHSLPAHPLHLMFSHTQKNEHALKIQGDNTWHKRLNGCMTPLTNRKSTNSVM